VCPNFEVEAESEESEKEGEGIEESGDEVGAIELEKMISEGFMLCSYTAALSQRWPKRLLWDFQGPG